MRPIKSTIFKFFKVHFGKKIRMVELVFSRSLSRVQSKFIAQERMEIILGQASHSSVWWGKGIIILMTSFLCVSVPVRGAEGVAAAEIVQLNRDSACIWKIHPLRSWY